MDQINLKGWEGRTASLTGHVSAMQAAMIHATLPGRSGPAPREGDPLPQLWHWCAFPPLAATEDLGRDGHAELAAMQRCVAGIGSPLRLLVASLRQPSDLVRLAAAGLRSFTISPELAAALLDSRTTAEAAAQFERDAQS